MLWKKSKTKQKQPGKGPENLQEDNQGEAPSTSSGGRRKNGEAHIATPPVARKAKRRNDGGKDNGRQKRREKKGDMKNAKNEKSKRGKRLQRLLLAEVVQGKNQAARGERRRKGK